MLELAPDGGWAASQSFDNWVEMVRARLGNLAPFDCQRACAFRSRWATTSVASACFRGDGSSRRFDVRTDRPAIPHHPGQRAAILGPMSWRPLGRPGWPPVCAKFDLDPQLGVGDPANGTAAPTPATTPSATSTPADGARSRSTSMAALRPLP